MVYYLTKNPEIKAKLMKEVLPPIEKVKNNIIEELDYETVIDFEFMQ